MKKTLLAVAQASSLTSFGAVAADKAPESSYELSGNVSLVSDYRFRGASQSDKKPAVQAGLDLSFKNGAYLGTWTSTVSQWANPSGEAEVDFYGGYKREFLGLGWDFGAIQYWYPHNVATGTAAKNNTFEYYAGAAYGPVSYKISRAAGNWFGVNASGATYQDLTVTHSFSEKLSVGAHIGRQSIYTTGADAGADYDFSDYKLSASYAVADGYTAGIAWQWMKFQKDTTKANWFTTTYDNGIKLYDSGLTVSITKPFYPNPEPPSPRVRRPQPKEEAYETDYRSDQALQAR